MTPEEIWIFKREVADPRMKRLLADVTVPEGFCCINNLEMSFWDGRSYGASTQFIASGLKKQNGIIVEYAFEEIDISCEEFVDAHKNCIFLADGDLKIYDQLENLTLVTDIRNLSRRCIEIFPELADCSDLNIQTSELEFLKMKELLVEKTKSDSLEEKTSLSEKIQAASYRVEDGFVEHSEKHER